MKEEQGNNVFHNRITYFNWFKINKKYKAKTSVYNKKSIKILDKNN